MPSGFSIVYNMQPACSVHLVILFAGIKAPQRAGIHFTESKDMRILSLLLSLFLAISAAFAQGTRDDFSRANKFLSWNVRKLVLDADITPHWIGKSSRFWYREPKLGSEEKTFLLADAAHNTLGPAFDHARLAAGLAKAAHHQHSATDLPFESFDFVENDSAIRFEAEGSTWTCTLSDYECSTSKTPS